MTHEILRRGLKLVREEHGEEGEGRRPSNAGHLDPRPEKNLGWNEGSRARVCGWAASGPDPSGGAGDGGKLPDVASPDDRTALYS